MVGICNAGRLDEFDGISSLQNALNHPEQQIDRLTRGLKVKDAFAGAPTFRRML